MKVYYVIPCLFLLGCNLLSDPPQPDPTDPRIKTQVENRIDRYVAGKIQACNDWVLTAAEEHVDSIIIFLISEYLPDTSEFPRRPERPERPGMLPLDSNFQARPIFQDSLRKLIKSSKALLPPVDSFNLIQDTARVDSL